MLGPVQGDDLLDCIGFQLIITYPHPDSEKNSPRASAVFWRTSAYPGAMRWQDDAQRLVDDRA